MKYHIIASDRGGPFNVAKFEGLGDAYECFTFLQTRRSRWFTMSIIKKSGRNERTLYHWENESPLVLSTITKGVTA